MIAGDTEAGGRWDARCEGRDAAYVQLHLPGTTGSAWHSPSEKSHHYVPRPHNLRPFEQPLAPVRNPQSLAIDTELAPAGFAPERSDRCTVTHRCPMPGRMPLVTATYRRHGQPPPAQRTFEKVAPYAATSHRDPAPD